MFNLNIHYVCSVHVVCISVPHIHVYSNYKYEKRFIIKIEKSRREKVFHDFMKLGYTNYMYLTTCVSYIYVRPHVI